jgi:glycosyltransferase involved in cell wall biosynthesis
MRDGHGPMLTIVSGSFPPRVSGSAILLANLLSSYTNKVSAIVGYNRYAGYDPAFLPPCPTQSLVLPRLLPRVYDRLSTRFPAMLCRSIQSPLIRRKLTTLGTRVVLAPFPREDFLVATFLATRRLHLPFYTHMHDLWMENIPPDTALAHFAAKWEPLILKNSRRILCMTEAMQRHYEKKYGIQTDLLPHTIPEQDLSRAPLEMRPARMAKPTVLFVGSISPVMNLDALKVLTSASELLPREYELLLCSSADFATLNRLGINSSRLQARYVSRAEVQRLQSEAHVLIAPLSHKNCSLDEVRTVFSTKLLEYLVSGRPSVVFAPEGSYHAESASKNGWAYVVTEDSATALAAAIVKVVTDEHLAAELVRGALQEARSRNAKHHAERLHRWVVADTTDTT